MTEQLLPFFSFDSGAIINGRRDIFKPKTFGAVWTAVEQMIASGQVRAVDEVRREVLKKDDEAAQWTKAQNGLFVPLTTDVQLATKQVLAEHPRLLGEGGVRNGADAFVIGLALANNGTVVTQEQSRNINKPRIPDVCDAMGIKWCTLPGFVDEQDWRVSVE